MSMSSVRVAMSPPAQEEQHSFLDDRLALSSCCWLCCVHFMLEIERWKAPLATLVFLNALLIRMTNIWSVKLCCLLLTDMHSCCPCLVSTTLDFACVTKLLRSLIVLDTLLAKLP